MVPILPERMLVSQGSSECCSTMVGRASSISARASTVFIEYNDWA